MKKLSSILFIIIVISSILLCPILYIRADYKFDDNQIKILYVLLIILASSISYCFIVGELTRNNSQMDKLWSILPEVYAWVIAIMGGMKPRLVVMAILATVWGIRLTYNFSKKGAYKLKFWQGEEDYRWKILREKKYFKNKLIWALFDLFFISIYQNVLIFLTVVPALLCVSGDYSFNGIDVFATLLMTFFIFYEGIADLEQWRFQTKKHEMLASGMKLEDLPEPYNLGFNTFGLWNISRHPNYFAEQMIWVSFYIFTIAAGYPLFNYSAIGALLLILLFVGSSILGEKISGSKYPLYEDYINNVNKFIPFRRYRKETKELVQNKETE